MAEGEPDRGVLATALRSDGKHWDKLYVDGGPSDHAERSGMCAWRARKSSSMPSA
jgi:3-oxoacyl-[acyl-carrier-protein] synthase III